MTVAALASTITHNEDGVTLAFAAPFRFLAPADLVVERISAAGVAALVRGVDWSATGGATDAGGTVTLVASTAGAQLRISRRTPLAQSTDYTTNDRFPAETHELALDRAMLIDQELDDTASALTARALRVPDGETLAELPAAAQRAGKYPHFAADGSLEVVGPQGTIDQAIDYVRARAGGVMIGYNMAAGAAGAINIGSSTAFDGLSGVMIIGGAGPKDNGNGSYLANDGHPNWNVLQSSLPFNPTELNIYGNGVGGVAVSNGTTTLTRSTGRQWGTFMVGRLMWFDGVAYTVLDATANTALLSGAPPAGTACWAYVYTTGSGTCTVAGGVVTRVLGEPFVPHTFTTDTFEFWLNGLPYTVTASNGGDSCTIAAPPADGTYAYSYRTNINNQVATWRLQAVAGSSEENFTGFAAPYAYVFGAQQRGSGKLRSAQFNSEYQAVMELPAYGKFVSFGGVQNAEALRALWQANAVNRFDVMGGLVGAAPSFRARGADANVAAHYDTKGTGAHVFSANAFASTQLEIFGTNAPDYLTLDAGTGSVPLAAAGGSANIDIRLIPKGTGAVRLGTKARFGTWTGSADAAVNGYMTHILDDGTTVKLATIA